MTTMTIQAGAHFGPKGSRFPVPFAIVAVNPVKPEATIREVIAEQVFTRTVKLSVLSHALRVHGA